MDRGSLRLLLTLVAMILAAGTLAAQPRRPVPSTSDDLPPLVDDSLRLVSCDSIALVRGMIGGLRAIGWGGAAKGARRQAGATVGGVRGSRIGAAPSTQEDLSWRYWRETRNEKIRLLLWTSSAAEEERGPTRVSSLALLWAQFRDTSGKTRWALGLARAEDTATECHRWRMGLSPRPENGGMQGSSIVASGLPSMEIAIGRGKDADSSVRVLIARDSLLYLSRNDRGDIPADGIRWFDHPPTGADMYRALGDRSQRPGDPAAPLWDWGAMNRQLGIWRTGGVARTVGGMIWRENWKEAVGEYPTREFRYRDGE